MANVKGLTLPTMNCKIHTIVRLFCNVYGYCQDVESVD